MGKDWIKKARESMERRGTVGEFTSYCGGKVTNECIERGLKAGGKRARQATFARTMRGLKQTGGPGYASTSQSIAQSQFSDYLRSQGYTSGITDPRALEAYGAMQLSQNEQGMYFYRDAQGNPIGNPGAVAPVSTTPTPQTPSVAPPVPVQSPKLDDPDNIVLSQSVPQAGSTAATPPPPSMATPGINPSGAGSGMGGVDAEMRMQEELMGDVAGGVGADAAAAGGLGNVNIDPSQAAAAAGKLYEIFQDPKSDPIEGPELDPSDPSYKFDQAAQDYNQMLEDLKQVDGTTDPMKSMINSFTGGSNANKAKNAGKAAGKLGLTKVANLAGKAAPVLAAFQAFGGFMEGGVNDQDPTTYTFGEGAADLMQLKFGEMIRQSKQRKYYRDLKKRMLNKKIQAGQEESRMVEDAAVGQNYGGRTYSYNTGMNTRFNYKLGGVKKLRGGYEVDLGRKDVGAVLFKGATHDEGGIDHKNDEVENNEVYINNLEIINPETGKKENAGYYFSEYLKDRNGKSFAKLALEAIKKGGTTKKLKERLATIAGANEEAAKNTGEMGRDKKYIAKYGGLRKKKRKSQTGNIDFDAAGLTVESGADLGAPGIPYVQPSQGGGFYGAAELNAFRERFGNEQLPDYLRASAAALQPRDRASVGQFQSDYNRYLGELYDQNPSLAESMDRDEFIISQGFNPTVGPGPSTLDRMYGEYTATRPIFTRAPQPLPEETPAKTEAVTDSTPPEDELNLNLQDIPYDEELVEPEEDFGINLPDIARGRDLLGLAAPLGQLVAPAYTLMNPYQQVDAPDIVPGVSLPRMPRENLKGDIDRATQAFATNVEAMRQAGLDPSSAGAFANLQTQYAGALGDISERQGQINLGLAAAETEDRLDASKFNVRNLTNQKQFNAQLDAIERKYGREEKLAAMDALFGRIQEIKNARDQQKAMDNYIDVLDEFDALDRKEEVNLQIKARNKAKRGGDDPNSPYWNKMKNRWLTDAEIRIGVAKKFPVTYKQGGIKRKHGGYYVGRLGAIKNKK